MQGLSVKFRTSAGFSVECWLSEIIAPAKRLAGAQGTGLRRNAPLTPRGRSLSRSARSPVELHTIAAVAHTPCGSPSRATAPQGTEPGRPCPRGSHAKPSPAVPVRGRLQRHILIRPASRRQPNSRGRTAGPLPTPIADDGAEGAWRSGQVFNRLGSMMTGP